MEARLKTPTRTKAEDGVRALATHVAGEHKANVLSSEAMPLRICRVGFTAATGIAHSVDVEAESLYEAAGLGLARLKSDGWIEGLGPATKLEIHVRQPGTHHTLSVKQLEKWIKSVNESPAETLKKAKIRHLLGY